MTRARDIANFGDGIATADIGDGQITTAKIASDAITDALLPAGSVLQVVQGTTATGSNSTSASWAATNLTVTITPTSASSKIYVACTGGMNGWAGSTGTTDQRGGLKIYRKIGSGSFAETEGSQSGQAVHYNGGGEYSGMSLALLDSPNTTEAVTYTLYFRRESGTLTFSVVRDSNNQAQITAMEIAG